MSLKQQLKKAKPFLTHYFYGVDDCLSLNGTEPLAVAFHPPRMGVIAKTQEFLSLVTQHTDVLQKAAEASNALTREQVMESAREQIMAEAASMTITKQMENITNMISFGEHLLTHYAFEAWHETIDVEPEKEAIIVCRSDAEEEAGNAEDGPTYISITKFTDEELFGLADLLIPTPGRKPAVVQVPIEGGDESVPSNVLGTFPPDPRKIAVESRTGNEHES